MVIRKEKYGRLGPHNHQSYPLVNVNKKPWKITMLFMGKSTISIAIFNSYVKLPEGNSNSSHIWHCCYPELPWVADPWVTFSMTPPRKKSRRVSSNHYHLVIWAFHGIYSWFMIAIENGPWK